MAGRMNLPPGFEIEEPRAMNLPAGFEIEKEPVFDITRMGDRPTMSLAGTVPEQQEQSKTLWEAIQHGWRQAGVNAVRGLAGLARAEAEIGGKLRQKFWEKTPLGRKPKFTAKLDESLKEWSRFMISGVEEYYRQRPEEAMQLEEDAGFLATTWDVISHPEKLLQGVVEAIPLMAEAMLGTVIAGPAGGIAVMAQPIIGNTYQTAREEGTDPLPAFIQASLTGYGEAAIEQWTFSKKLGLAKGFNRVLADGGKRVLWEGTKLYIRGTVEEGTQKLNENLWNWVFTDRSQLLTEGVVQAMAVGGPLELTMGGAFASIGAARSGGLVPNSEKIKRVEALKNRVNESSIPDEGKVELYAEFEQTMQDVLAGKFDTAPVEIEATADAAAQVDAAETVTKAKAEAIEGTQQLQDLEYEQLLELAEQGDELAAYRIQEMTAEATLEEQLPTFEVLFEQMLEGDEVAKTAIQEGQYKGGRSRQTELEAQSRVDISTPPTDEQTRNFATIKVHAIAKLLNMKSKNRQQIQFDLVGQKSLKKMNLEEVKEVQAYFVAQAKERGLSTSTGKELADFIKLNNTQIKVQDQSKQKPAELKKLLQAPNRLVGYFFAQSKRIERLMEALDGFTEGPLYNSIWKTVLTQTVNSRVSRNERVAKFREALLDIMAPELQTDEGIATAAEYIAEEETAAGKEARKLSKRAVRKLVGDSLQAKYITSGRTIISEATAVDPELSLNPSERIGVYLAMKNEDSRRHLLAGNFAAFENPNLAMLKVVEAMSSQEREIGDWILRDLESNFERANNAAKLGLGRELEQKDNYFPIRILDIDVLRQKDFLSTLEDKHTKQIVRIEPSEVKERKRGATQPLELDAFNVYLNHLTRIEQFIHMAPVAKSVGGILSTKEFRQAINNVTAGHGTGILDRWLNNSIRGHAADPVTGYLSKVALWSRRKGVLFFLAGNIASVSRQFISGFDAAATHPMTLLYMSKHLAASANPRYYNTLEKRMRELSPEIKTRSFDRYFANLKHQAQAANILTGKESWSEKALSWQRWADRRTVVTVWNAFYDSAIHSEAVQKQFELDGSEETAIAYANKMTARTQPMGNVEHLPDFFTGGTIERLLSTFQNQINNRWNFWAHDIYGMRKAGKISRKMVMYRVLFIHILPAMMFGAISRGGLPKDWEDALFDQTIYALGPLSLVGRVITDAMLGFAGGKTAVEDALTANIGKTLEAFIKGQPKKAAIPALKTIGGLTGRIPNQAIRTGQGIYDIMTGETDDLRRIIYSEWSLTNYGWPTSKEEKEKARRKRRLIQR